MQKFVVVLEILEKAFPESKGRANALTAKINVKSISQSQFDDLTKLKALGFEVEVNRSGAGLLIVVEEAPAKREALKYLDLVNSYNQTAGLVAGRRYRLRNSGQFCHAYGDNGLKQFSENCNKEDRVEMTFIGSMVITDSMPHLNGRIRNLFYDAHGKDRVYMMFGTDGLDYIDYEVTGRPNARE